MVQPRFVRTIGIDYSGAKTPTDRLSELRVYLAEGNARPVEVWRARNPADPQGDPIIIIGEAAHGNGNQLRRIHWSRRGISEWLVDELGNGVPTLVGIDHAFSFPRRYFHKYRLPEDDWNNFLEDFRRHWPTHQNGASVHNLRQRAYQYRKGRPLWFRETEVRTDTAKSVFQFDVRGQVAYQTHAGIPWLWYIRRKLGNRVQFWPFGGWDISPSCKSAIVEVYPSLWNRLFPTEGRNPHQHDAYCVARWMQCADQHGSLGTYLHPHLTKAERNQAMTEGWILGVM